MSRWVVWTSCFAVPLLVAWVHAERYGLYDFGTRYSTWWLVGYGLGFLGSALAFGVPGLVERAGQAIIGSALAALAPLLAASMFFLLVDPPIRSRLLVVGIPAVLFAVFVTMSLAVVAWSRHSHSTDRVLVVAGETERMAFERDIKRPPERKFTLVEIIDPCVVTADPELLGTLVHRHDVNLIVLSEAAQSVAVVVDQSAVLHERGMRIRGLAAFGDEWLGKFPIKELARTSLWFDIRDLQEGQYNRLKRMMDLLVACVVAPLFLVTVPLVAIGNRFGNHGPLFFRQERIGQQDEVFSMWKFRTMTIDANVGGKGEWTTESDPRITPFGKFLRRSHLDELPQIINVFGGSLSIVGPRPEQEHYVQQLTESIPFYRMRHTVKPGVTGWAQVKYPYGASEEDALEKLQYELYYLRHQSLSLDVRICARTLRTMFLGEGR